MLKTETAVLVYKGVEYPEYKVTKEGIMLGKNGSPLSSSFISGRAYTNIKVESGVVTVAVPYAIIETFKYQPDDPGFKTVGFLDGNSHNNKLENLFWTKKRDWWNDECVVIDLHVIDNVYREIGDNVLDVNTKIIANKLKYQKGLVDHIVDNCKFLIEKHNNEDFQMYANFNNSIKKDTCDTLIDYSPLEKDVDHAIMGYVTNKEDIDKIQGDYKMYEELLEVIMKSKQCDEDEAVKYIYDDMRRNGFKGPIITSDILKYINTDEGLASVMKDIDEEQEEVCENYIEFFANDPIEHTVMYIMKEDIPAFKYAGVGRKKMMDFILYKYGKDVYEYVKLNCFEELK